MHPVKVTEYRSAECPDADQCDAGAAGWVEEFGDFCDEPRHVIAVRGAAGETDRHEVSPHEGGRFANEGSQLMRINTSLGARNLALKISPVGAEPLNESGGNLHETPVSAFSMNRHRTDVICVTL